MVLCMLYLWCFVQQIEFNNDDGAQLSAYLLNSYRVNVYTLYVYTHVHTIVMK